MPQNNSRNAYRRSSATEISSKKLSKSEQDFAALHEHFILLQEQYRSVSKMHETAVKYGMELLDQNKTLREKLEAIERIKKVDTAEMIGLKIPPYLNKRFHVLRCDVSRTMLKPKFLN